MILRSLLASSMVKDNFHLRCTTVLSMNYNFNLGKIHRTLPMYEEYVAKYLPTRSLDRYNFSDIAETYWNIVSYDKFRKRKE